MNKTEKDELRARLTEEARNLSKLNGFVLAHYAAQALDDLKDSGLAKLFIEAAEAQIGTEDQAHPNDLGKYLYEIFKDNARAQLGHRKSLDASGWDSDSIKTTEKEWLKISKTFK